MSVSRQGLKIFSNTLSLAQSSIIDKFGDMAKNPAIMIELESIMCRLRGSTLFYNDDYSRMYYLTGSDWNKFDFVKFPTKDIIGLGIQGATFSLDDTAKQATYPSIVGVGFWNPGYYGVPCPEGFGVWEYNAWSFYNIEQPSTNPVEATYNLRLNYNYPIKYIGSSSYERVPFFEHGRYISIKNTSSTVGYDDAIWQFELTSEQLVGIKLKNHLDDMPLDIRFMYSPKLIQGYTSAWENVDVIYNSKSDLYYLAHTITDNNDGTYTVKINIPNDLLYCPNGNPTQNDHVANKYWHFIMFWGSTDEEAFNGNVTFRTLKSDNITSIPIRVASEYIIWPSKHFFRKDIATKITWVTDSINEKASNNPEGYNRQYLVALKRQHFSFDDTQLYGSYLEETVPSKYFLSNTLIDDDSLNSVSNYIVENLETDQYQSALFVGKTTGSFTSQVEYLVVLGPVFYSDFAVADWENFEYYPPVPEDYVELAKLIIKRAPDETYGALENNSNIVFDPFENQVQIKIFQNSIIYWYKQSVVSHAVQPMNDNLLISRLMPGFYNFLKQIRIDKGEDPIVASGANIIPYSAQIPSGLAGSRASLSSATSRGSIIFRKLLKRPYADILQPEIDEPLAIQFDNKSIRLIESIAYAPPSTEMLRLNADFLSITNKKLNIANTFELFHEPTDNCTAADASTSGSKTGLDYTLRMHLEDENENVLIKDWHINASKFFITVDEYNTRLDQEQSVAGYFTKDNISTIEEYRLQGYAGVVPDLVMGESRVLTNRFVSPEDSTKKTEEQFRAELEAQGYTPEEIDELVLQYLEDGGEFYVIDLRRYDNKFVKIRDAALSITTLSLATTPYFGNNLTNFYKVYQTEPSTILFSTLYADSFTISLENAAIGSLETYERLATTYYDQSFNIVSAIDMNLEWNRYGFKFSSGSGGPFSDIGLYLKTNLFVPADTKLSNTGTITLKIYDNSSSDRPDRLIATSSTVINFADILETFAEYRWKISADLIKFSSYWVILELSATPQGGDIALASISPYNEFTYQEISSEAFSFVSLSDTNSATFSIPIKIVLQPTNTTGALLNDSGQVNINIYSDDNNAIGEKLFTADSVNFEDLTENYATFTFSASNIGFNFEKDVKYWVVITESVRTRGGIINSNLENIIIDPIRFRLEESGTYKLFDDNNKKVWMKLFNEFPEIYGTFNRDDYSLYKWLPGPNASRQTSALLQREAYWSFRIKKFPEPSLVYIYPRAVGVKDTVPPSADKQLDFSIPPSEWMYVPYQKDIYVVVRLICGGVVKDYIKHLDPNVTPAPILVNNDYVKAESIAYMYVAKSLEELQNGTHGAPPGDRLVIRSS